MEQQKIGHRAWCKYIFRIFLLGLSALATVKVIFFFTDIDEQYAITMAYRMVCGDRMFLEMWEPHQTSGFLAAFLVKVYMLITGGVSGVAIYLRLAGALFQMLVSLFLYVTVKKFCSEDTAFIAALFYYNTLAKYNQSIDFANMLMWFSMLMLLCLLRYFLGEIRKPIWLVLAGINTSLLVLSYPTCLCAVVPVCLGLWFISEGRDKWRNEGRYLGTCGLCGAAWLMYFLSHMTLEEFAYGVSRMMTDGSHGATWAQKLHGYKGDLISILPYIMIAFALALAVWVFLKLCFKKNYSLLVVFLFSSMVQQLYIWLFRGPHVKFPSIFYFILLSVGIYRYLRREKYGIDKRNRVYQAFFWFGSITAVAILLAALAASNMRLYESSEYMMVGCIASVSYLDYENKQTKKWWGWVALLLICVAAVRKGYLMYYAFGVDTIFVTKQKAIEGPLAGVYCRYMDGYDYNMKGLVIDRYIPRGSKVMYVGVETLIYLQGEYEVCNFSTISTPYINERVLEYWDRFPEKYPEYIIWDAETPAESRPSAEVREEMLRDSELLADEEGLKIYKIKSDMGTD